MLTLAIRDTIAHTRRYLISAISVILGVAFLTATLALREELAETFLTGTAASVQGDLYVRGNGEVMRPPVPVRMADSIAQLPSVKQAVAEQQQSITLLGEDDRPLISAGIQNTAITDVSDLSPWQLTGSHPHGTEEVVVERSALSRLHRDVGDTLKFVAGEQTFTVKIVGSVANRHDITVPNVFMVSPELAHSLVSDPDTCQAIVVSVKDGQNISTVTDDIEALVGSGYSVVSSQQVADESTKAVREALDFVTTLLLVFIIIALGVSTFIITNTFHMAIKARQKEFAFLRAVGTSPLQVFTSVAVQGALIGLIGSLLGVGLGAGLLAVATWALRKLSLVSQITAAVSWPIFAVALAVGTLVAVVGSIMPAYSAAQTPPVEAMREVSGVREPSVLPRFFVGAGLITAGVVAMTLGARHSFDYAGVILGVGAAAVVLGTLVASPGLAVAMLRVVGWPLRHMREVSVRLGAANAVRNPRRTAATGGALIIGMALVSAGLVVADSLRASTADLVENELKADLIVTSLSPSEMVLPKGTDTLVSNTPQVAASQTLSMAFVQLLPGDVPAGATTAPPTAGETSSVQAPLTLPVGITNLRSLPDYLNLPIQSGSLAEAEDAGIVLPQQLAEQIGVDTGDVVTLMFGTERNTLTVKAIQSAQSLSTVALVTAKTAEDIGLTPIGVFRVLVKVDGPDNVMAVRDSLREKLPKSGVVTAMTKDDMISFSSEMITRALAVVYALVGLSVLIAILGIVNTLGLSVAERAQEIALTRAIGLSRSRVSSSIMIEAILTALYGTVVGIAVGTGCAVALVKYLADSGISTLSIPWTVLLLIVGGAIFTGWVAALAPGYRAARQPILEAIATD